MPLELFSLLCTLALADSEPSDLKVPPESPISCPELNEKLSELESNRNRMIEIRELNIQFISKLEEGRESQRMKATSNISIAERRIEAIDGEKSLTLERMQKRSCAPRS